MNFDLEVQWDASTLPKSFVFKFFDLAGFLIFSIFLLYIACIHILLPQLNCWKLLLQGKKNSYLQFQPLNGDVLYTELSEAAGNQWSVILSSPSINEVIVPKKDIYYYNSPNDPVPAYIVHAGKLYEDEPIGAEHLSMLLYHS